MLGPERGGEVHAPVDSLDAGHAELRGGSTTARTRQRLPERRLRRSIGWLGHDLQLYPELTARENLQFFAQLRGVGTADAAVDRALASAELVDRADDFVSSFSRGMRQRLALERALLHDPRLVLLDEPFTGLDRTSTGRLATRLGDSRRQGRLVILATHDVLLPADLIATAVSLRDGRFAGTTVRARVDGRSACRCAGGPLTVFARTAWLVFRKDVTVEVRSRETIATTLFFALSAVLVFAFALVKEGRVVADAAAGILWIAIAFSATLALGRTFERERHGDTLRALMLAPADRPAIYVGKLAGVFALVVAAEIVLVPLVAFLFGAALLQRPLLLAGLLLAGTLGFLAVGTLFAAMLARARSRDVLLPVLLYPVTIPVIIAGVRGTVALASPVPDEAMALFWLMLLLFFDVVFVTLALWTFEPLMTD